MTVCVGVGKLVTNVETEVVLIGVSDGLLLIVDDRVGVTVLDLDAV